MTKAKVEQPTGTNIIRANLEGPLLGFWVDLDDDQLTIKFFDALVTGSDAEAVRGLLRSAIVGAELPRGITPDSLDALKPRELRSLMNGIHATTQLADPH